MGCIAGQLGSYCPWLTPVIQSWHLQFGTPQGSAPCTGRAAAGGASLKAPGATRGLLDGLRQPSRSCPPVAAPALDLGTLLSPALQLRREQQQGRLSVPAKSAQVALGLNQR